MIAANDNFRQPKTSVLPFGVAPRGLCRTEGAAYIGVSPALFDEMVKDKRMPQPRVINARTVWDRIEVDQAFDDLPRKHVFEVNVWDEQLRAAS